MSPARKTRPEAADRYLLPREIFDKYGIPDFLLRLWHREGCRALGRPMKAKPVKDSPRRLKYREKDVERVANIEELPDGRFQDANGNWLTGAATRAEYGTGKYGFDYTYLSRWRKKTCPELGRPIQWREVRMKYGDLIVRRGERYVYFQPDLDAIAKARREALTPAEAVAKSKPYFDMLRLGTPEALAEVQLLAKEVVRLSSPEAEKACGIPARSIRRFANKPCRFLDGRKLETVRELRMYPKMVCPVDTFACEDLALIWKGRTEANDENSPWIPVGEWRTYTSYSASYLHNCIYAENCQPLGRALWAEQRWALLADGKRHRKVWHIHRDDLAKLGKIRNPSEATFEIMRPGEMKIQDAASEYRRAQKTILRCLAEHAPPDCVRSVSFRKSWNNRYATKVAPRAAIEAALRGENWTPEAEPAAKESEPKKPAKPSRKADSEHDAEDASAYVGASTLWGDRFSTYDKFKTWLKKTPETEVRRRRPRKNRLELHAGDWARYWDALHKAQFDASDG